MKSKSQNTSLGYSDFKSIREQNLYYVDKTSVIRAVHEGNQVMLITRPRRFGKTLTLSTLRYFYSNAGDYRPLFEGLAVGKDAEMMALQGQNPVIFLSFKKVKGENWEDSLRLACSVLESGLLEHSYLEKDPNFTDWYQKNLAMLQARKPDAVACGAVLLRLIDKLYEFHHERKVVVLVDEYDTPVTTGWLNGYYREVVDFLKVLLGDALKDNTKVAKSVFTGVLRVSKESFFSDFNNFATFSVIGQDLFSDKIGFVPEEVRQILRDHDLNGREWDDISKWYDGYRFGDTTIFNPWSILHYVEYPSKGTKPYWVNTSNNRLLMELFFQSSGRVRDTLDTLMKGGKVNTFVNEHFTYDTLHNNDDAVWNMLLFAGYLRAENQRLVVRKMYYDLSIPNQEVMYAYEVIIETWFREQLQADRTLDFMFEYLLKGEMKVFERFLRDFVERVFSYHDTESRYTENFFHAFLLGLFVRLDADFVIRSNREAGLGRYDIALLPKDPDKHAGFVFEIKMPDVAYKETLKQALNKAKKQLQLKKYAQEFADRGIAKVFQVALAVHGKEVLVKADLVAAP